MTELLRLSPKGLGELLVRLEDAYRVLVCSGTAGNQTYLPLAEAASQADPSGARAVEPLKAFFFPARQIVATGFGFSAIPPRPKPLCLAGVKACDLRTLRILDQVFLESGGRVDPFYQRDRAEALIISADCGTLLETCFCPVFDGTPWPEDGFDLNLSSLPGRWLVQIGSDRGQRLIALHPDLFEPASGEDIDARNSRRSFLLHELRAQVLRQQIPHQSAFQGAFAAATAHLWEEESRACVECGACNTICPTCHCFLLSEHPSDGTFARYRTWDACLLKDFARVAGGGNPRPRLWMRLRNRFLKKFEFFPKVAGMNACSGCGRCIEACPAGIDIRRILRRVTHEPGAESVSAG